MDKNSVDWQGPFTALITPFDAQGRIDEAAYRRHVDYVLGQGVRGVVANGCTGEFWAQSFDERKRILELAVDAVQGRVPVIGGTGGIYTPEVVALTRYAKEAGCDGAMVITPYFVRPSREDLIAHFKAVSDGADIPIMLYNIPRDTVNDLTPDIVDALADLEHVVAIKDSAFDFNIFYRTYLAAGDRIRIFVGPSTMFGVAALKMGAVGWVDTYSNIWGRGWWTSMRRSLGDDIDKARELQQRGLAIRDMFSSNGQNMYCTVKAALNMMGLSGGFPRPPLRPLAEPYLSELRDGMTRMGFPLVEAAAE